METGTLLCSFSELPGVRIRHTDGRELLLRGFCITGCFYTSDLFYQHGLRRAVRGTVVSQRGKIMRGYGLHADKEGIFAACKKTTA